MTQSELLAVLIERIDNIKDDTQEIKDHLVQLNGKVIETCLKLAKTEEIAKAAALQSEINKKRLDSLIIPLGLGVMAAIVAIAAAVIQGMA